MPKKPFNTNEVLSAATTNFGLLEMSLYSLARVLLSQDSYNYAKNQTFTNCARTLQVVIRETGSENAEAKIGVLEEAIQLYKIRNKIFHNPLIPIVESDGAQAKLNHGLLNTKTGQIIDGFDLKTINDHAVSANQISGKLADIINDA